MPDIKTGRIVFARNTKGGSKGRGDITFSIDYRHFKNVSGGKIRLVPGPNVSGMPTCSLNFDSVPASHKAGPCCEPNVAGLYGDGMTGGGGGGDSASIGDCNADQRRFPSTVWDPTAKYTLAETHDFFHIDVTFEDIEYVEGCDGKTVMMCVCDTVFDDGAGGFLTASLTGWDLTTRMIQVTTTSDNYYWYKLKNCPSGDGNTRGGFDPTHNCYPKTVPIGGHNLWVFAGPNGGLGLLNPGMVKVSNVRRTGAPATVGHRNCLHCYPVDLGEKILNTDRFGVKSDNPFADSSCELTDRAGGASTAKGTKLFNDTGTATCDSYAQTVQSGPLANEDDECHKCLGGNARECSRNIIKALFSLGWGRGATTRVRKVTKEESSTTDGYTNEGHRSVVEMSSTSYALDHKHTFSFAPPKADGWGADDKHLGIEKFGHGQTLDCNLYRYEGAARTVRNPDRLGALDNLDPTPLGSVAFNLGEAFGEIALNQQYQVNMLEKQIADLIWDTVDPNDPRIKSGTIRSAGPVFEQLYTTTAALKLGISVNDYIHAKWSTTGTIARKSGIDPNVIEESSETVTLVTEASVDIDDLKQLCDDLSFFFNQNLSLASRTAVNMNNAKANIRTVVENSLSIKFEMASAGSTENWTWQPDKSSGLDATDDDFRAHLNRLKTRSGWFNNDDADQPLAILKYLFIPTNMTMDHTYALANGIKVDSSLNIGARTFSSEVSLFDGDVWELFTPDGAAKEENHPDLGRIKAGVRLEMTDIGKATALSFEIPITYSKTFAPAALRGVASGRVDAGLSIKRDPSTGEWDMTPSAEMSADVLKYFKYDYDVMEGKGNLRAVVGAGGQFKKLSELFDAATGIKTAFNWDIDLEYDFDTGAYTASAGIGMALYEELFNFTKFHSAFGSLMLEVQMRTYIRASSGSGSEGFTSGGGYFYTGVAGRLKYNNHVLSWLGFPIDIHPWVGFGCALSYTFSAPNTTLEDHQNGYHTNNGSTSIENQTETLGWGAFFGTFGFDWEMADNIRQYLYMRHRNMLFDIPILGPFVGSIAAKVPGLSKVGTREPLVTYLIRAQTARSYMAFNAASAVCSKERDQALVDIGNKFLRAYMDVKPKTRIGAKPWIHETFDAQWLGAEARPTALNHPIRLARGTIYYLARSLAIFTEKSPYCNWDITELTTLRSLVWPNTDTEKYKRSKPVPGHRNWQGGCNRNVFQALDPFAHDKDGGAGSAFPYITPTTIGTPIIGSPKAKRPEKPDGTEHTTRQQQSAIYREFGFWNAYEMLKAFQHVPSLFSDNKVPASIGGGQALGGKDKDLVHYYQEWIYAHPKCDCLRRRYYEVQRNSNYWNIFAINSLTNLNIRDAFVQMGRHTQDTIIGKIMDKVADDTFDAMINLDFNTDIEWQKDGGDGPEVEEIVESINPDTLKATVGGVYDILVAAGQADKYHYARNFRHMNKDMVKPSPDGQWSRHWTSWWEDEILKPDEGNVTFMEWIKSFASRSTGDRGDDKNAKYIDRDEFIKNTLADLDEDGLANCNSWKKIFCIFGDLIGSFFRWTLRLPFRILLKINPIQWIFGTLRSLWNVYKIDKDYLINHRGNRGYELRGAIVGETDDKGEEVTPRLKNLCDDPEVNPVKGTAPYSLVDHSCMKIVDVYPRQWYATIEDYFTVPGSATMHPDLPDEIKKQKLRSFFLANGLRQEQETPNLNDYNNWQNTTSENEGVYSIYDMGKAQNDPSLGANFGTVCIHSLNLRSELSSDNAYVPQYKKYSFYLWELINNPVTASLFDAPKTLGDDLASLNVNELQRDTLHADGTPGGDGISDRCGLCLRKNHTAADVVPPVELHLNPRKLGLKSGGYLMGYSQDGWYDPQNFPYDTARGRIKGTNPEPLNSANHSYYTNVVWWDNEDGATSTAASAGNSASSAHTNNLKPIITNTTAREDLDCDTEWTNTAGNSSYGANGVIGISDFVSGNHFLITGDQHRYEVLHNDLGVPGSLKQAKLQQHIENFSPCLDWEKLSESSGPNPSTTDVTQKDDIAGSQQSLMGLLWMPKTAAEDPDRYNAAAVPGLVGKDHTQKGFLFQSSYDDELHKKIFTNPKDGTSYSCSELYSKWLIPLWSCISPAHGRYGDGTSNVRKGFWDPDGEGDGAAHFPDRWDQIAPLIAQKGGHEKYQGQLEGWGCPDAYGRCQIGHTLPQSTRQWTKPPHGYDTEYDFSKIGYNASRKYLRAADIYYGLKSLWVMILGTVSYSSLPHIKAVQKNGLKMLKAQAKIIEMIWRLQMNKEISNSMPGNGFWDVVTVPESQTRNSFFTRWLLGQISEVGKRNRLGGWKPAKYHAHAGYAGFMNFSMNFNTRWLDEDDFTFSWPNAIDENLSCVWSWMATRGFLTHELLKPTWRETMWAWGVVQGINLYTGGFQATSSTGRLTIGLPSAKADILSVYPGVNAIIFNNTWRTTGITPRESAIIHTSYPVGLARDTRYYLRFDGVAGGRTWFTLHLTSADAQNNVNHQGGAVAGVSNHNGFYYNDRMGELDRSKCIDQGLWIPPPDYDGDEENIDKTPKAEGAIGDLSQRWRGRGWTKDNHWSIFDEFHQVWSSPHTLGFRARKAHWSDGWWRLLWGVPPEPGQKTLGGNEQLGGMVQFMLCCPMNYLGATYNMANGTVQQKPFYGPKGTNDPDGQGDTFPFRMRAGFNHSFKSVAISNENLANSWKLIEYDVTRFNGNYFDNANDDPLASTGIPENAYVYNRTFGVWADNDILFYRCAEATATPTRRRGGRGGGFGLMTEVWTTNKMDPRALCMIPDHRVFLPRSGDDADRNALTWMWEQLATCEMLSRWVQCLDRPQWLRDGAYSSGSVSRSKWQGWARKWW